MMSSHNSTTDIDKSNAISQKITKATEACLREAESKILSNITNFKLAIGSRSMEANKIQMSHQLALITEKIIQSQQIDAGAEEQTIDKQKEHEELEIKKTEAENFIKEINQKETLVKAQLKEKQNRIEQKKIQKIKEEQEKLEYQRLIKVKEKEEKKKRKHEEFVIRLRERDEMRKRLVNQTMPVDEYLYQKNIRIESIEHQKKEEEIHKAISIKKELYKPLDTAEINEHEKKYIQLKKEIMDRRNSVKLVEKTKSEIAMKQISKLQRPIHQKIAEEYKNYKQAYSKEKEFKEQNFEKMKKMAMLMQNMHKPTISQAKRREIQETLDQEKKREKSLKSAAYSPRMEAGTQHHGSESTRYPWRENMSKEPKSKEESMLPTLPPKPKYQDYLVGVRKKHRNPKTFYINALKSVIENDSMNRNEKYERVKYQVEHLEELAKRKEKLVKITKDAHYKDYEDASDMLIDAIKVKLSLLDQ